MAQHLRLSRPLTTSHVNKHLRYRMSGLGYVWLLLIACCAISVALQIISMATKEHLLGEAGAALPVNGVTYYGTIRRTYSIFHACTAPALSETSTARVYVPNPCVVPTSNCKETLDRIRVIQACSIIALFFSAVTLLMLIVIVWSRSLRAKKPLIFTMIGMIALAFVFRLTLWSLIADFATNTSLCNNAFLLIPGVPSPRFGPSFVVEVISWIMLFFVLILLCLVLAYESGFMPSSGASSSSSSSSSSSGDEAPKGNSHPIYQQDTITEAF